MKNKFVRSLILVICFVFYVPVVANAATTTSEQTDVIWQYGEDGGFTFNFSMTVESKIYYEVVNNQYVNFKQSWNLTHTPYSSQYGIDACGTGIVVIKETRYGSSLQYSWSLPYRTSYYYDPDVYYIYGGYNSANATKITSYKPFTAKFQNRSEAITNQSKCLGGGSVKDDWSFSY